MTTATISSKELLNDIQATVQQLQSAVQSLTEKAFNTVPFAGSWTAAQVIIHVTKSMEGVGQVMQLAAEPATRDAGERITELQQLFLDFSIKMKSPAFILPEEGPHTKETVLQQLRQAEEALQKATAGARLDDLVKELPFGDATKLELLHFALYHTRRHAHQLQAIVAALHNDSRIQ
jgi:hypothetical protein